MAVALKTFSAKVNLTTPADPDAGGDPAGTFEAIVSVFNNTDSYGDIVAPGAFTKTLAEWVVKGRPIPVVWSHDLRDPDSILGHYTEAEETTEGLRLKGILDLSHPKAARVHSLMQQGLIAEFSWSGEVREYELIEEEDSFFYSMKIHDVDLWEAGPCFKGANPDTELISIKSDGSVAGRLATPSHGKDHPRLSAKNVDALKAARDALDALLSAPLDLGKEDTAQKDVQRASAATARTRAQLALAQIN